MNEQFKGEEGQTLENLENQKSIAFQMAMDEEKNIMEQIDNVLATTPDRAEAEKIVLEKYTDLMDEAMKKSRQALDEWISATKKVIEKE